MLDTDICSYAMRGRHPRLLNTMDEKVASGAEISISVITYAELRMGAAIAANPDKHHQAIELFCTRAHRILPWTKDAADESAQLYAALRRQGCPIGLNDTMIAAHAIESNYVLVTDNTRHFSKVPELEVENWAR